MLSLPAAATGSRRGTAQTVSSASRTPSLVASVVMRASSAGRSADMIYGGRAASGPRLTARSGRCQGKKGSPAMRSIDIHAHLMPQSLWRAVDAGRDWYGTTYERDEGLGTTITHGRRMRVQTPKLRFTPEERLQDMDVQGIDVQVVSIHTPLFSYQLDASRGRQLAREVNAEIAGMTRQWPRRFAGLATLPLQDVGAAVDELERAVTVLGLKGAALDTVVNDITWDEPRFLPLFTAAESMGAVLFFHPQPQ